MTLTKTTIDLIEKEIVRNEMSVREAIEYVWKLCEKENTEVRE